MGLLWCSANNTGREPKVRKVAGSRRGPTFHVLMSVGDRWRNESLYSHVSSEPSGAGLYNNVDNTTSRSTRETRPKKRRRPVMMMTYQSNVPHIKRGSARLRRPPGLRTFLSS